MKPETQQRYANRHKETTGISSVAFVVKLNLAVDYIHKNIFMKVLNQDYFIARAKPQTTTALKS